MSNPKFIRATRVRRAGGFALDALLLTLACAGLSFIIPAWPVVDPAQFPLFLGMLGGYKALAENLCHRSAGHWILGMKVQYFERSGWRLRTLIRQAWLLVPFLVWRSSPIAGAWVTGVFALIFFGTALVSSQKRSLFDHFSGASVVMT